MNDRCAAFLVPSSWFFVEPLAQRVGLLDFLDLLAVLIPDLAGDVAFFVPASFKAVLLYLPCS